MRSRAPRASGSPPWASPVRISTSRGSAVSCDERMHVLGVELGRVVGSERRLDPALRLGRVVGLDRALGGERDARACPLRGDRRGKSGRTAADHEHVESSRGLHPPRVPSSVIRCITESYFMSGPGPSPTPAIESPHAADRRCHAPRLHRGRPRGHARRGRGADDGEERRRRRRQGLRQPDRDPHRARPAQGDGGPGPLERGARAPVDDGRPGHRRRQTRMSRRRRG